MHSVLFCLHNLPNFFFFFFNDTATTEIYTLSLHDALPISPTPWWRSTSRASRRKSDATCPTRGRSEEHTSELQSRLHLVCRLLLEKKKKHTNFSQSLLCIHHLSSISISHIELRTLSD